MLLRHLQRRTCWSHNDRNIIHPRPGKKSLRYSLVGERALAGLPLSFQADTQNSDGSCCSRCLPAEK